MAYTPKEAQELKQACQNRADELGCHNCKACKYGWNTVKFPWAYEDFCYLACWWRPKWGAPLSRIDVCPKTYSDGSLSSMCKVNTEV